MLTTNQQDLNTQLLEAIWLPLHEALPFRNRSCDLQASKTSTATTNSHLIPSPRHQSALHIDAHDMSCCRTGRYEPDLLASNAFDPMGLRQVGIRLLPRCLILHIAAVTGCSSRQVKSAGQDVKRKWHTSSSLSVFFFVRRVACLPTCTASLQSEIPREVE